MPDKKLTDNEIIKALECCKSVIGGNCDACPYVCCNMYEESDAIKDAISLINRQKAEIERLQKVNDSFTDIGKLYSEIKAEAIKEFAERLKNSADYCTGTIEFDTEDIDNLVKEMVGDGDGGE
jgi:hypothetical protein